ncbi:hypothetical protein [Sulfurimonas hydrogeniphila]|uniref:hypothetical protein n=1 Tax=Sulfurimonas hydrogeniphila TaxID=2509341 RepID=UPI00125FD2FD|nr:hypothetical protein [Sulfurimonas hydrogeniphila]
MSENSEKILYLILKKLEEQEELLFLTVSTLTTKKAVANLLGKTDRMIDYYIQNGTFQDGVHYFINEKGKKEFIPSGILDYKRNKNRKKEEKKLETEKKIYHPSVQNIIQGLKVG